MKHLKYCTPIILIRKFNILEKIELKDFIPLTAKGSRLDQALAELFPQYSRSRLQQWIKEGVVLVNNTVQCTAKHKVVGGEEIVISANLPPEVSWQGENLQIDIIYEDSEIIIVNKAAGMVTHPARGAPSATLVNALIHRIPTLACLPRAGVIHRLDKDTTGLLIIAKTLIAHHHLVKQLAQREIKRQYLALVQGEIPYGGKVELPIGRHTRVRTKMAVVRTGKHALTHYRIKKRWSGFTFLDVQLETGRTHQIRVHLAYIHHPLVGDPLYGKSLLPSFAKSKELLPLVKQFPRQALHAYHLEFEHPTSQEWLSFDAPIPDDLAAIIKELDQAHNKNLT